MYDDDFIDPRDDFDSLAADDCVERGFDDDDEDCEVEHDGQPDEYTEWQDFQGGDDWDHGQFDRDDC